MLINWQTLLNIYRRKVTFHYMWRPIHSHFGKKSKRNLHRIRPFSSEMAKIPFTMMRSKKSAMMIYNSVIRRAKNQQIGKGNSHFVSVLSNTLNDTVNKLVLWSVCFSVVHMTIHLPSSLMCYLLPHTHTQSWTKATSFSFSFKWHIHIPLD